MFFLGCQYKLSKWKGQAEDYLVKIRLLPFALDRRSTKDFGSILVLFIQNRCNPF